MGIEAVIKESDAPLGLCFSFEEDPNAEPRIEQVAVYKILPFLRDDQILRGPDDQVPVPTPGWRFGDNQSLSPLPEDQVPLLVPSPVSIVPHGSTVAIDSGWKIVFSEDFVDSAEYLAAELDSRFGLQLSLDQKLATDGTGERLIRLHSQPTAVNGETREAYLLSVSEQRIEVMANDSTGVFYGIQSLLNLFPVTAFSREQRKFPCRACRSETPLDSDTVGFTLTSVETFNQGDHPADHGRHGHVQAESFVALYYGR